MNHSLLGIVDLDHTAIGEERLVRQSLRRRPDDCDAKTRLLGRADPIVRWEFLERLRQLRVEKDTRQHPVRLHGDPIGIVPVRRVQADGRELVPLGGGQDPCRAERPMMDPLAIGTFVEALDRPRVDGPHPIERRIGVLDPLPVEARRGQGALQQ